MTGFKDAISKSLGKANDFFNDKQRQYRLQQSLDRENLRLTSLFNELGKVCYYESPIISNRNIQVIKDDIAQCMNTIEALKQELIAETTTA